MTKQSLVSKNQMVKDLTNAPYTGNETNLASRFPPIINILQSDKQYVAFAEYNSEDELTKDRAILFLGKGAGKLFVRRNMNSVQDLTDSLKGTVLKIEQGYEILEMVEGKKKVVDSGRNMMQTADKKLFLMQNPGKEVRNMVKVILCLWDDPVIAKQMIKNGENPYALLILKGSGFKSWFAAQRMMDSAAMSSETYMHKKAKGLVVSAFSFTISSMKEKTEIAEFYIPSIVVTMNDAATAHAFMPFVNELRELSMFDRVAQAIEERDAAKALPEPENKNIAKEATQVGLVDDDVIGDDPVFGNK